MRAKPVVWSDTVVLDMVEALDPTSNHGYIET